MSLLTVAQALARNVGLVVPSVVATAPQREWSEAMEMANETGQEVARRVDWGVLTRVVTSPSVGAFVTLPADFDRMVPGITVRSGQSILRPLTRPEWGSLITTSGLPRYFLLEGQTITLWPTPVAPVQVTVTYQSENWITNATAYVRDTDTALIDEALIEKGLIARWRRQKGMDYADFEAEYEAALADRARFDGRSRL